MQLRIERLALELDKIISVDEPIKELASGFGGDDWRTIYFTSRTQLGSVNLKIAGTPVPAPKRS